MGRQAHYSGGDPGRNLLASVVYQAILEATGRTVLYGQIEPDPAASAAWLYSDRCAIWLDCLDIDPAAFYERLAALGISPPPILENEEVIYDDSK